MKKINSFHYFRDVASIARKIVRASQMKQDTEANNRVVTKTFNADFQAHLLNLTAKRVRELVQSEELISSTYIENQQIKFTQDELYHNMEQRNMLPKRSDDSPLVVTISQYKGGVGKTTSSVNLAVYLALSGYRVTLIDIDPQGTATEQLWKGSPISIPDANITGMDSIKLEDTVYSILSAREDFNKKAYDELTLDTAWNNLKLIPSCVMLDSINLEMSLDTTERNKEFYWDRLRNKVNEFGETDIVIIDSAPNINALNLSALFASNILLMPILASMSDVSSFYQYVSHMEMAVDDLLRRRLLSEARLPHFIPRILISNYEGGDVGSSKPSVEEIIKKLSKLTAKDKGLESKDTFVRTVLQNYLGEYLLNQPILRSDAVKEAANKFVPIFEIDPNSKGKDGLKRFNVTPRTLSRSETSFIEFGKEIKSLIESIR